MIKLSLKQLNLDNEPVWGLYFVLLKKINIYTMISDQRQLQQIEAADSDRDSFLLLDSYHIDEYSGVPIGIFCLLSKKGNFLLD